MSAAPQPLLYVVPPSGATLLDRARHRAAEQLVNRSTRAYDGFDEATPEAASFNVGMAYGVWGIQGDQLDALMSIGYHLTDHAQRVTRTHRYIVTAALTADAATISVLALRGRASADTAQLDPAKRPEVEAATDGPDPLRGWRPLAAGPCLYAGLRLAVAGGWSV